MDFKEIITQLNKLKEWYLWMKSKEDKIKLVASDNKKYKKLMYELVTNPMWKKGNEVKLFCMKYGFNFEEFCELSIRLAEGHITEKDIWKIYNNYSKTKN